MSGEPRAVNPGLAGNRMLSENRINAPNRIIKQLHKINDLIHYSLFTIHHSPLTTHHSPFTIHHSPPTSMSRIIIIASFGPIIGWALIAEINGADPFQVLDAIFNGDD